MFLMLLLYYRTLKCRECNLEDLVVQVTNKNCRFVRGSSKLKSDFIVESERQNQRTVHSATVRSQSTILFLGMVVSVAVQNVACSNNV